MPISLIRRGNGEGSSWGTNAEIEFVKGLGTGAFREQKVSRRVLLEKYIEACKHRTNWKYINRERVLAFATSLLRTV